VIDMAEQSRNMQRPRRATVGIGFAAILLSGCYTVNLSEDGIYVPQSAPTLTVEALADQAPGYGLEPQTVIAADGARLTGVLLKRAGADRTVLYFGGNMFTVGKSGPRLAGRLAPLGVNIMMIDFRGYGASASAAPNAYLLMSDALAVFDHLAALPGVEPSEIVVHGQSLGSFMAGHVAALRPTGGVVLESSATTAEAFARANIPGLARPFIRLNIAESLRGQGNLQQMNRLEEPLLLLVGSDDDVTPAAFSRELFAASTLPATRKRLAVVEGAGHNDVLTHPTGLRAYADFLDLTR